MREFIKSYEVFCDDPFGFAYTMVYKEDDNYYQVQHPEREGSFDVKSLSKPAPIPPKLFMGRWDSSLTEAPRPVPVDSFLKRPPVLLPDGYEEIIVRADEDEIGEIPAPWHSMVAEAKIYEILKDHSHPNICAYYGCVRDGDYFTDLCLKKYPRSLDDAVESKDNTVDIDKVLDGVSKGLHFLHDTLGLVHGDINPANIMLDDDGNAIIIDFDSCIPIGQAFGSRKGGAPGWERDKKDTIAVPENDWHGLTLLSKFMKEGPGSVTP